MFVVIWSMHVLSRDRCASPPPPSLSPSLHPPSLYLYHSSSLHLSLSFSLFFFVPFVCASVFSLGLLVWMCVLQEIRPNLELKWMKAGHCPHDERPEEANAHISEWMKRLAADPPDFPIAYIPRYQKIPLNFKNVFDL